MNIANTMYTDNILKGAACGMNGVFIPKKSELPQSNFSDVLSKMTGKKYGEVKNTDYSENVNSAEKSKQSQFERLGLDEEGKVKEDFKDALKSISKCVKELRKTPDSETKISLETEISQCLKEIMQIFGIPDENISQCVQSVLPMLTEAAPKLFSIDNMHNLDVKAIHFTASENSGDLLKTIVQTLESNNVTDSNGSKISMDSMFALLADKVGIKITAEDIKAKVNNIVSSDKKLSAVDIREINKLVGKSEINDVIKTSEEEPVKFGDALNVLKKLNSSNISSANGNSVKIDSADVKTEAVDLNENLAAGMVKPAEFVPETGDSVKIEMTVQKNDIISRIAQIASTVKKDGTYELKMKLMPEGIGELLVKITVNKNQVGVNIVTDNAAAQKELSTQTNSLKSVLESHQMSLTNLDVGSRENHRQHSPEEKHRNAHTIINSGETAEVSDTDNMQNVKNLRNYYLNRVVYMNV